MIVIKLRDTHDGPVIWKFQIDHIPEAGLDLHYKGCVYAYLRTFHEAQDSACDTVVYANLDTVVEYVCRGGIE